MRTPSILFIAFLVLLIGCGGGTVTPDAATPARPACEEIIERCHELDLGTGEIHECHELAEGDGTTNEDCVAMHDHCFDVCVATDAGPLNDSGPASDSGPVDAAHGH